MSYKNIGDVVVFIYAAMESIAHMSSCDSEGDGEVHGLVCLAAQLAFEVCTVCNTVWLENFELGWNKS